MDELDRRLTQLIKDHCVALAEGDEDGLLETWQLEGFEDEECYEDHYVRVVNDLYDQAYEFWKPIKQRWMRLDKRLRLAGTFGLKGSPTTSDLVLLPQAIEKAVSMQTEARPRPNVETVSVADEQFVGILNLCGSLEMDAGGFDGILKRALYDAKKYGIGFIKQTVCDEKGLFNADRSLRFTKVDPRNIFPDPMANSWDWRDQAFLICAERRDITEIRTLWPEEGWEVEGEELYSRDYDHAKDGGVAGIAWTSKMNGDQHTFGKRKGALVKECWLKQNSKTFIPEMDEFKNVRRDMHGEPVGKWVARYPNGRVLIVANGVLLVDGENPYSHGMPPYTPIPDKLAEHLFSYGDSEVLALLEDKMNILHKDMMRNARANINAPWVVDDMAFDSRDKYDKLSSEEGSIITKAAGTEVNRLDPKELPQSSFSLISWVQSVFNDLSGVSNIMQGQIEKGAQLSADAIQNLQGAGAANIKFKVNLQEDALKVFGKQLYCNIRDTYPDKFEAEIKDPANGKTKTIVWDKTREVDDKHFRIQVGSSLPGNKSGQMDTAVKLFDHDLIDREAALDQIQFPGRADIVKRMKEKEKILLALDLQKKQGGNKTGRAGRK